MNKNKKLIAKRNDRKNPYNISYDNYMDTTSSNTECTGLIPCGDKDRLDFERYRDIFRFGGYE